jgi:hypothetical protein
VPAAVRADAVATATVRLGALSGVACVACSVNAEMVVTVVAEMLVGRTHLLEGFSNFLPPACRDILLERYTEGKDGYAPRSSDHSMQSADDGCAGGMEGGDREPAAECEGSPTKPPSESTKFASKGKTRSPKGTRIDHTHPLVADMPVEVKRKRDSTSEMLLRPPKALLNSYAGMGKRMSQQQARRTRRWHARRVAGGLEMVYCDGWYRRMGLKVLAALTLTRGMPCITPDLASAAQEGHRTPQSCAGSAHPPSLGARC